MGSSNSQRPPEKRKGQRRLGIVTAPVLFILLGGSTTISRAQDAPVDSTAPTTAPAGAIQATPIVVTANRIPTPTSQVGSSVSVINSQDLANENVPMVQDSLQYLPSMDITRSGGPGQITSVFTRGADSDHTLVLIDGIEANDPTSPTRAFDFSTLTTDNIDQIEVIRGPQSTLWGSNAIGGVVNVVTKRGEGPPSGYVYTEDGSFNTYREGAGISGGNDKLNYSLSLSQQNSDGISAADSKFGNKEPDGYVISTVSEKVGVIFSKQFDVDFISRYQFADVDIDNGGGPGADNPDRELRSNIGYFGIVPHVYLFDDRWVQTYRFTYSYYARNDTDRQFPANQNGGVAKLDWQNDVKIAKNQTVTAGLVLGNENISTEGIHKGNSQLGTYLQDAISFDNRLFLTGGFRYEHLEVGGTDLTYRFTGAYIFPTGTTLRASDGTGYKAPTLSDLYSSYGSRTLKPEKSNGADIGISQDILQRRLTVDGTYFYNNYRDLIDYDFATNKEINVGKALSQGVELGVTARPTDSLTTKLSYTYTDTRDLATHQTLDRRAPNAATGQITWKYNKKGQITAGVVYESGRPDVDPVTFGRTHDKGYIVANLATSYDLTDHATLTLRADNLFNQHYEEVSGYGEPGFAVYAGVRVKF